LMKNYYLLFLMFVLTVSCSQDFNDSVETVPLENYVTNSVQTNAAISLNSIVSQLVAGYHTATLSNVPTTLTKKITFLDSVSLQNTAFLQIKPAGYTLLNTTQAQRFLQSYEEEYTTLNTSRAVNDYFELIIAKEDSLTTLMRWVSADTVLTNN